jgi:hypothetical protein
MKLYKTTYFKSDDGEAQTGRFFDGTAAEASKRRTSLKAADKESKPVTTTVDVFAKKTELLQFLNELVA